MSFLSLVGWLLFIFLCFGLKTALKPYLATKEFTYIDPNTKQQVTVPAYPANYIAIIGILIVGILFLGFVMAGAVYMRDLSLFHGVIKL